jgi:adenosylmethionine-8-amino-7-oxononanoate aminotransferase
MPLGVTTCTQQIFDAFLSDQKSKTFFHGHSYTANPLACAAALASLQLLCKNETRQQINNISQQHKRFTETSQGNKNLNDIRISGTILAMNFSVADQSYFSTIRDKAYTYFIQNGILLRPLGNILYVMPPYCISDKELNYIYHHLLKFCHTQ